jgi:hypothetical protein
MPNTTVDYWDVSGVSLNTYVQNLNSWGGSREAPAPLRGENLKIPYMYGEKFIPKQPDARQMTLEGWVTAERNGVESRDNLKQNWRDLRKLLWRPQDEFALTRRWKNESGVSKTATAMAQFTGGLEPSIDNLLLRFSCELRLADPFFYGSEISLPISTSYVNITEHGDYPTKKMFIDLVGPLTYPKVTFVSNGGSNFITESTTTYPSIAAGTTVTLDIENFKATETTGGVTTKTSGKVVNTISAAWAKMGREMNGTDPRVILGGTGTGTATLRYRPAYH